MTREAKQLRKRTPLVLEAIGNSLALGYEKYGEDDYDLQEALSGIPAYISLYNDCSLKFVKLSKGVGRMFDLRIADVESFDTMPAVDKQRFLKLAHDALDVGGFLTMLIAEVARLLNVDPRELAKNSFSERYKQPEGHE